MADNANNTRHSWYVRHAGRISGPFLAGHIQRELLLGHFRASDEVSHDQRNWSAIDSHPELIPEILKADLEDPLVRDRLAAARRWADDGEGGSSLSGQPEFDPEHPDHRQDDHGHAPMLEEKLKRTRLDRWRNNILSLLILSVIGGLIYFYFSRTEPVTDTPVECGSPPRPGINLSNCFLQGVSYTGMDISGARLNNVNLTGADLRRVDLSRSDLSYSLLSLAVIEGANLHGARLVGTDLNAANLRNTDLGDADLSYANLYGADISGADFSGARLDQTRWIDGRLCQPGSTGTCR
jgi:hypothetical protein